MSPALQAAFLPSEPPGSLDMDYGTLVRTVLKNCVMNVANNHVPLAFTSWCGLQLSVCDFFGKICSLSTLQVH